MAVVAELTAISAITGAFSAYEAGKMRQLAYEHEAAIAEINAEQIRIEGVFTIADQTTELANTLALQNVMAAASGRVGGVGSLQNLQETSFSNFEADKKRIETTGRARQVSTLMDSATKRAAGKTAAKQGLLSGISQLTAGAAKTSQFIK